MSIWRQAPDIEALMAAQKNTIGEVLDIRFESFTDDSLTASMVVDARTHQPFGLLHGGASVVLAESLVRWPVTCSSIRANTFVWVLKSTPTICVACAPDASPGWSGPCI